MKVYIDVSNLTTVNFVTGIQRVVREVVLRFCKNARFETILLSYSNDNEIFNIIDTENFINYFEKGVGSKNSFYSHRKLRLEDIEPGSVFFDIDSVWNSRMRRSYVLPLLKDHGVKIAVQVYDVIPITDPQYCHQNTIFFFMDYLGAFLQYADIIITSADTTKDALNDLSDKLGLPHKEIVVVPLGSDFKKKENSDEKVDEDVKKTVGKRKYALIIGTIEPRKNHEILLKAFDKALFDRDMCLVFAGRFGWNIDELKKKIENHPQLGKKFFHFTGANDATIDYLYKNAFVTLFPTFNEGFGLPIIESIERRTPVVASDRRVLREVGTDFCEYFDPNNEDELIQIIEGYLDDPKKYKQVKAHLEDYVPYTWDMSAKEMEKALFTLDKKSDIVIPEIKQMVILSARDDMLLETIPYIEGFMPFIKEIVICCPDFTVEKLKNAYKGRLELKFLTDSMVLNGRKLPDDHACRNLFLRCMAFQNDMIDDAFIMSDDDYRPLHMIDSDVFVKNGKYQAYYCYDLKDWKGTAGAPTSYDISMFKTSEFLRENQYPGKQYSSHQPQAVDKRIFLEMLEKHKGIETTGYCDWSTYFNFAQYYYPDLYDAVPYVSMSWPGAPTDWNMQYIPNKFVFENFYPEQYAQGELFAGFSTEYGEHTVSENVQKVMLYMNRQLKAEKDRSAYEMYTKMYNYRYGQDPIFLIDAAESKTKIYLPEYVAIGMSSCTKITFSVNNPSDKNLRLEYYYTQLNGDRITMPDGIDVAPGIGQIDLSVFGIRYKGTFLLNIACVAEEAETVSQCKILMI